MRFRVLYTTVPIPADMGQALATLTRANQKVEPTGMRALRVPAGARLREAPRAH